MTTHLLNGKIRNLRIFYFDKIMKGLNYVR